MCEIKGICYCEEEFCSKIYPVSYGIDGPTDEDGRTILPCGHRLERLVADATCFRDDNHFAEDYRWLKDHDFISDDAEWALEDSKAPRR